MFGGVEVLLLGMFVVVVAVVAIVVALAVALRARPDRRLTSEVVTARRHASATSAVALVAMVGAPALALVLLGATRMSEIGWPVPFGSAIRLTACLPLLGSLLGVIVLLLGELTWPRPTGVSRTALLHDRSVRSLITRGWSTWAGATTALTACLLLLGGVLADASGDSITHVRANGSSSAGPFPGWTYAGPQLIVLGLCVLAALLTLRAVARRSAVVTADLDTDRLLRRASVARVCRALVAGCLVTLGPDLILGGNAARNAFAGEHHAIAFGGGTSLLGVLVLLLGLVVLALPVPRLVGRPAYVAQGPSISA